MMHLKLMLVVFVGAAIWALVRSSYEGSNIKENVIDATWDAVYVCFGVGLSYLIL